MKTITINSAKHGVKEVMVDDEDYESMSRFKWYLKKSTNIFYAYCNIYSKGVGKIVMMHREIMNPEKGKVIDHINGNGLDNRKANMRECLSAENSRNRKKSIGTLSIYKGLYYDKNTSKKWRVLIKANGKKIRLGRFRTEIEAALAYDEAAKIHHGKFARLNFPIKE